MYYYTIYDCDDNCLYSCVNLIELCDLTGYPVKQLNQSFKKSATGYINVLIGRRLHKVYRFKY